MKYKNITNACIFEYIICIIALASYIALDFRQSAAIITGVCTVVLLSSFILLSLVKTFRKYMPYLYATIFIANCFVACAMEPITALSPFIFFTAAVFISFYANPVANLYFLALSDIAMLSFVVFFNNSIEIVMNSNKFAIIFILYNIAVIATVFLVYYFRKTINSSQKNLSAAVKSNFRRNAFINAMVHEIHTPINKTNSLCVEMLRKTPSDELRELTYDIQSVNREILSTIENTSDYMRLEAKKVRIAKEPYIFNSFVNDLINLCSSKVYGDDVDFIVDVDTDIPYELIGDCTRITQVVLNIFTNAVKFTKSGSITLKISARRILSGVNLNITVTDTGTGIDPKVANKIFTAYSDSESSTHIGLGIAKQLVTLMGGFISINSRLAQGTEIKLCIPQEIVNNENFIEIKDKSAVVLMYIEKSQLREPMEKLFEKLGVRFSFCDSSAEFMMKKEETNITHIITDYSYYIFNKPIFDILSQRAEIIVTKSSGRSEKPLPKSIKRVFYPIYAFTVAMLLNNNVRENDEFNITYTAKRANILVVDDSPANISAAFAFLKPYGTTLFSADGGDEAIKIIMNNRIDLVFMDHLMPKPDGVETTRLIRDNDGDYFKNLPIIALTANSANDTKKLLLKSGMNDMICKPIELKAIDSVLFKWLPQELIDKEENPIKMSFETMGINSYEYLNVNQALSRMGSGIEMYADVLESFYNSFEPTKSSLERAINEHDLQSYTILAHSVKGSAANICAVSLSELARQLEAAAKNGELAFVKERNQQLISLYEKTNSCIENFFTDNNLQLHRIIRLTETLPQIEQVLSQRNAQASYDLIKHLLSFNLKADTRALLEAALDDVDCFDFKSALEHIERLKNEEPYKKEQQ